MRQNAILVAGIQRAVVGWKSIVDRSDTREHRAFMVQIVLTAAQQQRQNLTAAALARADLGNR